MHQGSKQEKRLHDTLAKLKLQTDFKPLILADAYSGVCGGFNNDSQDTNRASLAGIWQFTGYSHRWRLNGVNSIINYFNFGY